MQQLGITAFLGLSVFAAAIAAPVTPQRHSPAAKSPALLEERLADAKVDVVESENGIYIVGFVEQPLGRYNGGDARFPAPPRNNNGKPDVRSARARNYLEHLETVQRGHIERASRLVGRELAAQMKFKHALNAVVMKLTLDEASRIGALPEVALIEPYAEYELDTDAGPALIGAPSIWAGQSTFNGANTRGEGMVLGILDSGINIDSPSFAAIEPGNADVPGGYVHVNPLGAGNYLGSCLPGGADEGLCNDKLIGLYDHVYNVQCGAAPPNPPCPVGTLDEPSVEDSNGHGTHTASTAGGNATTAIFNGFPLNIQGVARHANIIAFDVCYTRLSDNGGLCPNVSSIAAVDRAIADGLVDVINFSIGGGGQPWSDAVSLAFLSASNSGIFVATSAGNDGPAASTLGHQEPWTSSTGASTHNRVFAYDFDLTGPGTPPANTQNLLVRPGGSPISTTTFADTPLIVSPGFGNGLTDGCTAFPADTFRRPATPEGTPGIAVLRLVSGGACVSSARQPTALAAGAAGILFVVDSPVSLGAINNTWQMDLVDWQKVEAAIAGNPGDARGTITAPLNVYLTQQADAMAGFSSRGPSNFDLLKPDIMAPGLNILAAYAGNANVVNAISGTSMASPHQAGAAALIRALHPSWTPSEIKSAIQTTSVSTNLFKENRLTPANPFDYGAGRVDLTRAARAGLVLGETAENYSAANPATGGNPATLNQASMQARNCVGTCSFTRRVRGTHAGAVTWSLSVSGFPAGAVNVTPSSFTLGTNDTRAITVAFDSLQLTQNVYTFGELTLTPSNPSIPVAHMPIAIRAAQPDIDVQPASLNVTLAPNSSTSRSVTIANLGNPTLVWSVDTAGTTPLELQRIPPNNANGFSSNFFSNQTPTPAGLYTADDIVPTVPAQLSVIRTDGFLTGGTVATLLSNLATQVTFKVYADNAGVPAGNPEAGAGGELYSCVRTPTGPNSGGLTFIQPDTQFSHIQLDLQAAAAAGCPPGPNLVAGQRYWVSVFPSVPGTTTSRRWIRFRGTAQTFNPGVTISPTIAPVTPWTPIAAVSQFASVLTGQVACGAPWFSVSPSGASLGLGASGNATFDIDSTGLATGTYFAFACFDTNGTDPDEAKVAVPITLVVSGSPTAIGAAGNATPSSVLPGQSTLMRVTVTPGQLPTSTGLGVTANLTPIGGSAAQAFVDDGTNGDVAAGDNVFSYTATVPVGTTTGNKSITFSATDAQARTTNGSFTLNVAAPTNPTAFGRSLPTLARPTEVVLLTAHVTNGANPTSTGITVTGNLSAIGGSATQAFLDNGLNGDIAAGDNVFSWKGPVAAGTTDGVKSMPLTIVDAQGRSPTATPAVPLSVFSLPTTAAVSPTTVARGGFTLMTVSVTPGLSPASTGITVEANLTPIGGSATQPLFDDGTNGDAVAGNNVFSFRANVPEATTSGAKALVATSRDAEGRVGTATANLTVSTQINPVVTATAATPDTAARGGSTLLTVDVTPGSSPASTALAVRANLTSIGGSSTQLFRDDGLQGDDVAGDNRWSFIASVATNAAPGAKSLPVTVTDGQNRTALGTIGMTVLTPIAPTGVGVATPSSIEATASTLLTVDVTPGSDPASTGIAVAANLTPIGGVAAQAFRDDGDEGDEAAGDGRWSYLATVPLGTAAGLKTLVATVSDAESRSSTADITLTVLTPGAPSGVGLATPASVAVTGTSLLTVEVTPGTNPASTGIDVSADLTAIGGEAEQAFRNDGQFGDAAANDAIWSYQATVLVGTEDGAKQFVATIEDDEGRSSTATIDLAVIEGTVPTGVGAADPATSYVGGTTVLTVDTSPGADPVSSGISVSADLTAIGGLAVQPFVDDGSGDDAAANDGTFTYTATVGATTTLGAKSMTATISDAELRSSTASIALTIEGPTAISASGAASPENVLAGGTTLLTVTTEPGTNPPSSGVAVVADLRAIGGDDEQAFLDDGQNGDEVQGDGIYSYAATVSAGTAPGVKNMGVSVGDAQSRTATTSIALNVLEPGAPSAVGIAVPTSAGPGGTATLVVSVTPGTNPTSTGITVSADLTAIGGSATQAFRDDGEGGDQTAGDNVFTYVATVGDVQPGAKALPATATDAQARTALATITLTVQGGTTTLLIDGFEDP